MANSRDFMIIRDKEMISTNTLNSAFEQAFNANSWGRIGCILSIGSISRPSTTDFDISDVILSLPSTFINNTDSSAQTLDGIEVTIGLISVNIPIGDTQIVSAEFNVVTDTDNMVMGSSPYNAGTGSTIQYDYYVRDAEKSVVEYTTGTGQTGVDIFKITNINGVDYIVEPVIGFTSKLPIFTEVQNPELYTNVTALPSSAVAPISLVTALTDNIEWIARCQYVDGTNINVIFSQIGKGGNDIPTTPKNLTGLTANTDYHVFLQYSYINNVISSLTIEYYTDINGNPSLPTDFVQQRIFSFKSTTIAEIPKFIHHYDFVNLLDTTTTTLGSGNSTTTQFNVPSIDAALEMFVKFEDNSNINATVTQYGSEVDFRGSAKYFSNTGQLTISNIGAKDIQYACVGYVDLNAATLVKGLY